MNYKKTIKNIPLLGPVLSYLWNRLNHTAKHAATYWIKKYLSNKSIIVVQIGSNDGKSDDPLFKMAHTNTQWQLLLVEPVPYLFEALKRNYGSSSRFHFENCGINEHGQAQPFYMISKQAFIDIPDLSQGHEQIGSFNKSHVLSLGGKRIEKYIEAMEVNCMTLQQLIDKNNLNTINALVIDAEGYDWKILRQLDLKKYQPELIYFEHLNLNESEKKEALSNLSAHYEIFTFGINFICFHKSVIKEKDLTFLQAREQASKVSLR